MVGSLLCLGVVLDAFQTVILPRRPKGRFRITRFFFLMTWHPWRALGDRLRRRARDQMFSIFGPVSLFLLLAVWAALLTCGFGLLYFSLGTPFSDSLNTAHSVWSNLRTDFYVSGTTLFTLGLGDVIPLTLGTRFLLVMESGTGLGFVALVIGYVPVLYQAFSRREVSVAMLDGRAGSPPTAAELLRRHGYKGGHVTLITLLAEWERWAAELLESHVSYPLLCYYRSQHDNQSWLSALVCILDTCALLITTVEGEPVRQAQLTFAMARHALIDLGHIFSIGAEVDGAKGRASIPDRLPIKDFTILCDTLGEIHMRLCGDPASHQRLTDIRGLYEPHAYAICSYLRLDLPLWATEQKKDNLWKKVADLRMTSEGALDAGQHVSENALAAHLHDEEHGF